MSKIVYLSNNSSDNLEAVLKGFEGHSLEDLGAGQGLASVTWADLADGWKDMALSFFWRLKLKMRK